MEVVGQVGAFGEELSDEAVPVFVGAALPWRVWVAIVALGTSTFTIVTTELAPIGILSQLADSFQKSEATTGLVVSVYAWLAAAVALVSVFLFGRFPRKGLLVALMFVFCEGTDGKGKEYAHKQ